MQREYKAAFADLFSLFLPQGVLRSRYNKNSFSNEFLVKNKQNKKIKEKCNMANEPERQQFEELSPIKTEKHYLKKRFLSID